MHNLKCPALKSPTPKLVIPTEAKRSGGICNSTIPHPAYCHPERSEGSAFTAICIASDSPEGTQTHDSRYPSALTSPRLTLHPSSRRIHNILKTVLLALLAWNALPAFAANHVTGEQLEQMLEASQTLSDAQLATELSQLSLTERLSAARFARCDARLPGPRSRQALTTLDDISGFLDPPAAEIPATPKPEIETQRKIIASTVDYATKTLRQLPNLYATRVTQSFQDRPEFQKEFSLTSYDPFHPVSRYSAGVIYRNGKEEVNSRAASTGDAPQGLTTSGEFGPILVTMLLDAAHGNLSWSRWEQGSSGPLAVFRFTVPAEKSHYDVSFCCTWSLSGARQYFHQVSGYQGELAVDPASGAILRVSLKATGLKRPDPILSANILVEYAPVELGGKTYICPVKGVALSLAQHLGSFSESHAIGAADTTAPLQTSLNQVTFEQYHLFTGTARLLAGNTEPPSQPPPAADPSSLPNSPSPSDAATRAPHPADSRTVAGAAPAQPESTAAFSPASAAPPTPPPIPEISVTPATGLPDTPASSGAGYSLRLTARLVDIGVVAYDKKGHPLANLKPEDFEIDDDGRKQALRFFSRISHDPAGDDPSLAPSTDPATGAPISTPQPAYTNSRAATLAATGTEANTTVLLLDAANLAWPDLANARKEMLRFLISLPAAERVAVYIVQGNDFQVLEEATGDHALLAAKLTRWAPTAQDLARSQQEEARNRQQFDTVRSAADLQSVNGNLPGAPDTAITPDPQLRAYGSDPGGEAFSMLIDIARHLAAIPGHKNLVWITSDNVLAEWSGHAVGPDKGSKNLNPAAIRALEAMNDAQVAVYPLDASQLEASSVGPDTRTRNVELDPAASGPPPPRNMSAGRATAELQQDVRSIQRPIVQLAESTGGRPIPRAANLAAALDSVVADGTATYLLSFTPGSPADDRYHQLTVKLPSEHGVKLRYRTGYQAAKDPSTLKDRVRQALAQPLDSSGIALTANPVSTPLGATIKLNIAAGDLALQQQNDRWAGKLDIFLVQREDTGTHTRVSGQIIDLKLQQATYEKAVKSGVPFDQLIEREQKTGSIRIVVVDETTGRIGSVTVPATAMEGKWR